ncbi:MAG: AsmA-like C-terminal domain-containing protein [Proteobacteria bacterium]|nr:AsmA-like C-terminal domain-containing protein [Pseudomonadota bacterium]
MGHNKSKKTYLAVVIALLVLGAVLAAYLSTTTFDMTRYSGALAARVMEHTGVRCNTGSIKLRALPSVVITFEDVEFFEEAEVFIGVKKITATFSPVKLLLGDLEPRSIEIVEPDLLVKRYSDGSPNLGALFLANIHPTGTLKTLRLHNGSSTIVDEAVVGNTQRFYLKGMEIIFDKGPGDKFTSSLTTMLNSTPIEISSTGWFEGSKLRFKGPATVGAFDLAMFNPYIKQNAPGAEIKGSATADLTFAFDAGLVIEGALNYSGLTAKAPKLFNETIGAGAGTAEVLLDIDAKEIRAGLDGVKFQLGDFDLSGGAEITKQHKAGAEGRTLKLKLASTPIPFKRFQALVPPNLFTGSLGEKMGGLKPLGGTVTVEELSVDGRMDSLQKIGVLARDGKVGLRLRLDNIEFTGSVLKETFSGVKGTISLDRDRLSLKGFSGNYGHGVLEELNAEVTGLVTEQKYDLTVKAFFEAGKTLEILKAVYSKQGNISVKLLKGIEASGITGLDLNLQGNLKELAPTEYSGTVRLKNASFSHKAMLLKLSRLTGEIGFDTEKLTIKDLTGTVWESNFNLNGTVEQYLDSPKLDIGIVGDLAQETVKAVAGASSLKGLSIGANVPMSLRVVGDAKVLSGHASVDFTGSGLKYANIIDKRPGYPLALDMDLIKVANDEVSEVRIKNFLLRTGSSRAGVTGVYNLRNKAYTVTAATSELSVADIAGLTTALEESDTTAGSVGFSFKASKKEGESEPTYEGVATVTEASFKSPAIPSQVDRLNMSAEYGPKSRRIDIKRLVAGRTNMKGKIALTPKAAPSTVAEAASDGNRRKWDIEFDLDAEGLFIGDLLKRVEENDRELSSTIGKREKKAGKSRNLLDSIHSGGGTLRVAHGSALGMSLEELTTDIKIDPDKISAEEVRFKKNRGHVESSIIYYRTDASPLLFDSVSKVTGIDLKQFVSELGAKKTIIEGEINLDVKLYCKRGHTPVTEGLTGTASMRVGQGKLWKFLMMSKIFSIVNIFSIDELLQQGLPYKRITGDFVMKEGVVRSNNIYLESDTLRMTAMGEISVPDQYIDSVLMLHPFVTIDKIVTNIPLIGWVIGGKEKSAASMYYEIVGPLKKPYIDPVPEKSLSTGVRDMMERLGKELEVNEENISK